jgi:hypothetical protein
VRRVQIDTINSFDKLARPALKAQLWWLKHKNPSLDAEYYSHYFQIVNSFNFKMKYI